MLIIWIDDLLFMMRLNVLKQHPHCQPQRQPLATWDTDALRRQYESKVSLECSFYSRRPLLSCKPVHVELPKLRSTSPAWTTRTPETPPKTQIPVTTPHDMYARAC
jgi:hypothetical protein